jgi:D-alanine--poly(phosphoribitol) ligase subunit 1
MTNNHIHELLTHLRYDNEDIAIVDNKSSITYGELFSEVCHLTKKINRFPSQRIGIIFNSSIPAYVSILACWLSKKSYVPISPEYPISRIQDIIKIGKISLLLTEPDETATNEISIKSIPVVLKLDHKKQPIKYSPAQFSIPNNEDEAYVLFTSGTTGKPKGVPIKHSNLFNFNLAFKELDYILSSEDRFLQMFEITFDLSIMSYLIPLTIGASLYVPDKNKIKPIAIYEALVTHKITFALLIPSVIKTLEPFIQNETIEHLKHTQFCGEIFSEHQSQIWRKLCPNSTIDNVYGPTEATIYCSQYRLPPSKEPSTQNGIVSIGKPMLGTKFHIHQEELYIGGKQITSGYLNQIQPESFIRFNGQKYYKTGDIVKNIEGQYYCLGRLDQQIKIQGFRVELSEIEFAYNSLFKDSESIATLIQTEQKEQIILHILERPDFNDFELILKKLKAKLPNYMLPAKIIAKSSWPLNANGKIDRKALTHEAKLS